MDLEKLHDWLEWPFIKETLMDMELRKGWWRPLWVAYPMLPSAWCGMENARTQSNKCVGCDKETLSRPMCSCYAWRGWHTRSENRLMTVDGSHWGHREIALVFPIYFLSIAWFSLQRVRPVKWRWFIIPSKILLELRVKELTSTNQARSFHRTATGRWQRQSVV